MGSFMSAEKNYISKELKQSEKKIDNKNQLKLIKTLKIYISIKI